MARASLYSVPEGTWVRLFDIAGNSLHGHVRAVPTGRAVIGANNIFVSNWQVESGHWELEVLTKEQQMDKITLEFNAAEILHVVSDRPRGGMIGPRFTGWSKLEVAAHDVLASVLPDEDEEALAEARYRSEHGI